MSRAKCSLDRRVPTFLEGGQSEKHHLGGLRKDDLLFYFVRNRNVRDSYPISCVQVRILLQSKSCGGRGPGKDAIGVGRNNSENWRFLVGVDATTVLRREEFVPIC